ncbi:hypothetical protein ACP70R_017614 [Stipagrostis hirtigluma subsp. patula]
MPRRESSEPHASSIAGDRSPSPCRDRRRRRLHDDEREGLKGSSEYDRSLSDSSGSDGSRRHRRRRKSRGRSRSEGHRRRHRRRSRGWESDDSDDGSETSYESEESRDRKSRKRSRRHKSSKKSGESKMKKESKGGSTRKKSRRSDPDDSGKSENAIHNAKNGDGEKGDTIRFMEEIVAQKQPALGDKAPLIVGPMPPPHVEAAQVNYGRALRPGEGDAIAQFVQRGKRIPRRGEVGLSAEEIQRFEDAGYVMSGSRHARINAVRLRKENQVYSAEEKRALAAFNHDQKARRECKVQDDLRRLVDRELGKLDGAETERDPFADK